ncbi:hypothetical protein EIP91_005645 [Steccherinum ochraceum]|uniref:Uncharacterized protein n=1 Tax=Steccherinum ochraceum TaxID=92696 RepID=A0A4R0RM11_9APHY|nr:hypothetical protein EIP91_005645 [Steccherinum ochraceum]
MNETLQRILFKNPLIPLASLLFGSVWFGLSILAYVIGIFLPHSQLPPSAVPHPRRNGSGRTAARTPARAAAAAPLPSILASNNGPPQHHVRFPNTVTAAQSLSRPRPMKRWSSPAHLDSMPPSTVHEQEPTALVPVLEPLPEFNGPQVPPISINKVLSQLAHVDSDSLASCSPVSSTQEDDAESSLSRASSMTHARKASLTSKLPSMNVFKNRSRRVKSEGNHSRSGSICSSAASSPPCTPPRIVLELKPDPEKGSTSTVSSAERPSPPRSGFAHAFKLRPKRASAAAILSAAPDKSHVLVSDTIRAIQQTPSPPPSPDRPNKTPPSAPRSRSQSRRKPFASILSLASPPARPNPVAPMASSLEEILDDRPHTAAVDGGFPSTSHRSMFSPVTPKLCPKRPGSSSSSSSQSQQQPPSRTQPYGYPYFAMMPNGEYASDAVASPPVDISAARRPSYVGSRSNSLDSFEEKDDEEQLEDATTPTPANMGAASGAINTLGLEFGMLATTPRAARHPRREVATVS